MILTSVQMQIVLIASATAVACSIPGTYLVLRKMSMISDAISHSILLGIVGAYFFVGKLDSPFLVLAAGFTGLATVLLVELIIKTQLVKEDAAIGIVYPLMFSIAVVLISIYADNIHIDTDSVLMGELAFSALKRFVVNGVDVGPVAIYQIGSVMFLNIILAFVFYKELKLVVFDPDYAYTAGFAPKKVIYSLMLMVAFTIVVAFEVAGSIMVVGFMVGPAVVASYYTKRLWSLLFLAPFVGILASVSGYFAAHHFDVSIAGCIISVIGVMFILSIIFAPGRGIIAKLMNRKKVKTELSSDMLLVHLLHHEVLGDYKVENEYNCLLNHFNWEEEFLRHIIDACVKKGYISFSGQMVMLKERGKQKAEKALEK